jgi:hypothetical protein
MWRNSSKAVFFKKKKQRDCRSAANEMAVLKNQQSRSACS